MHCESVVGTVQTRRPVELAALNVFIAEDEPMLLFSLEEILSELGCVVVGSATRVSEALAFAANQAFDVAVLDVSLADGVIDPVVSALTQRGIPVVVASGMSRGEAAERFCGVIMLQKPYRDRDLQLALIKALAQPKS